MSCFCTKPAKGASLLLDAGAAPTIRHIRQLARLSRPQFAAALHCHPSSVKRWETVKRFAKMDSLAWLVYLAYLRPDPVNGWRKAALCLAPDGQMAAEVGQNQYKSSADYTQVAGYQRRNKKASSQVNTTPPPQPPIQPS